LLAPGDEAPDGARLLLVEDRQEALELMAARPETVVGVPLPLDKRAASEVVDLVRAGVPLVYLVGEDGTALDPATQAPNLTELLPGVHDRLVEEGLRDRVTVVARGAIAQAEHPPKAMILGADAVALDWPLLIALECRLEGSCVDDAHTCGLEERIADEDWAVQRVVNLMASWHSQFLEVLGAMGLREMRRLRGERGRAMFADHLEETSFADIIRVDDIGVAS
jgi:glutamate synthase domain-containing protein 2